mgnify:FL=1
MCSFTCESADFIVYHYQCYLINDHVLHCQTVLNSILYATYIMVYVVLVYKCLVHLLICYVTNAISCGQSLLLLLTKIFTREGMSNLYVIDSCCVVVATVNKITCVVVYV